MFQTVQMQVEVSWNVDNTVHDLLPHELACLVHVLTFVSYFHVGRCIVAVDELPALAGMAHVDYGYGNLAHHFVVVGPRIEQRIENRHEQEENENTLVLEGCLHLLGPDIASVFYSFLYLL